MNVTVGTFCLGLALAAGGCAGENGERTYEGDDYSFTYPGDWEERDGSSFAGNERDVVVGPPDGEFELMAVLFAGNRRTNVTVDNVDEAITDLASDLAADDGIEVVEGPTRMEVGGLPAAQAQMSGTNDQGVEITSRQTYVYQGSTWWLLLCNARPAQFEELSRGCNQVEDSLQFDD